MSDILNDQKPENEFCEWSDVAHNLSSENQKLQRPLYLKHTEDKQIIFCDN